ncbi:WD40 repeat domain-containing protein [bacterium]|nr:MAG: WD40 repeat domain-containing protein [bacterium]
MISRWVLLVGGILVLLIGLGWLMRVAASWRPVAMGRVGTPTDGNSILLASNKRVLLTERFITSPSLVAFDTRSGKVQPRRFAEERIAGLAGESVWSLYWDKSQHRGYVETDVPKRRFSFDLAEFSPYERTPALFRVFPRENQVLFLFKGRVYRWNLQTTRLERSIRLGDEVSSWPIALSRDGHTFVRCDLETFFVGDTNTGKITKRVAFQGFRFFESIHLSPYGKYALFERPSSPSQMRVVDVATGKSLWVFDNSHNDVNDWAICDDEQTIFVRINKGNTWEVRDLKTGTLQSRLPVVPGASMVAAAPDGEALYSVARGILYRQRGR